MGKVIDLTTEENSELVSALEKLLREAKMGRISSVAAVVIRDDEPDFVLQTSDLTTLETIGALEALKVELLSNP